MGKLKRSFNIFGFEDEEFEVKEEEMETENSSELNEEEDSDSDTSKDFEESVDENSEDVDIGSESDEDVSEDDEEDNEEESEESLMSYSIESLSKIVSLEEKSFNNAFIVKGAVLEYYNKNKGSIINSYITAYQNLYKTIRKLYYKEEPKIKTFSQTAKYMEKSKKSFVDRSGKSLSPYYDEDVYKKMISDTVTGEINRLVSKNKIKSIEKARIRVPFLVVKILDQKMLPLIRSSVFKLSKKYFGIRSIGIRPLISKIGETRLIKPFVQGAKYTTAYYNAENVFQNILGSNMHEIEKCIPKNFILAPPKTQIFKNSIIFYLEYMPNAYDIQVIIEKKIKNETNK